MLGAAIGVLVGVVAAAASEVPAQGSDVASQLHQLRVGDAADLKAVRHCRHRGRTDRGVVIDTVLGEDAVAVLFAVQLLDALVEAFSSAPSPSVRGDAEHFASASVPWLVDGKFDAFGGGNNSSGESGGVSSDFGFGGRHFHA